MPTIRIPQEHWGKVWRALVASGPVARLEQQPVYCVSDAQLRLLRQRKLPFELLPETNGQAGDSNHE